MKNSIETKTVKYESEKDTKEAAAPAAKKTGLVRFARSDRPLLRGHVTHLINHG